MYIYAHLHHNKHSQVASAECTRRTRSIVRSRCRSFPLLSSLTHSHSQHTPYYHLAYNRRRRLVTPARFYAAHRLHTHTNTRVVRVNDSQHNSRVLSVHSLCALYVASSSTTTTGPRTSTASTAAVSSRAVVQPLASLSLSVRRPGPPFRLLVRRYRRALRVSQVSHTTHTRLHAPTIYTAHTRRHRSAAATHTHTPSSSSSSTSSRWSCCRCRCCCCWSRIAVLVVHSYINKHKTYVPARVVVKRS